jgi:hypothetical protein
MFVLFVSKPSHIPNLDTSIVGEASVLVEEMMARDLA